VARRVAEQLGVDLGALAAAVTARPIQREDVEHFAAQARETAAPAHAPAPSATRAPMSATRRVIAQRMHASTQTTAPVTLTTEADATELVKLRTQLKNDKAAGKQIVPSFTDLFAKLCAHALLEHPALNARFEGEEIVVEPAVHVGIAVDTERGLVVPVVRDVDSKSLRQIAAESDALIQRARDGKAQAAELRGSTFTITNLGMYEIDAFTPIINLPECAVLGLGRAALKQVVLDEEGHTTVRRMMFLSLTFDHRLVDGAPAARFLQRVKQLAEQPYLWLVS
jgi:pyruvate dehydrogenase E2 component (dihydrolipoamide acetyltransferase)